MPYCLSSFYETSSEAKIRQGDRSSNLKNLPKSNVVLNFHLPMPCQITAGIVPLLKAKQQVRNETRTKAKHWKCRPIFLLSWRWRCDSEKKNFGRKRVTCKKNLSPVSSRPYIENLHRLTKNRPPIG